MQEQSEIFKEFIKNIKISEPLIPVINNVDVKNESRKKY